MYTAFCIKHVSAILVNMEVKYLGLIYLWDKYLNESEQITSLSSEIKLILYENNLKHVYDAQLVFPVKSVVKQLEESFYRKQMVLVENICKNKPKLRTFVHFKDLKTISPHVYKPLSFLQRNTISKIRLGIPSIRLETARYLRPILPEVQGLRYCKNGDPESESK